MIKDLTPVLALDVKTRQIIDKFWTDKSKPPNPELFTGVMGVSAYNTAKEAWDRHQKFIKNNKGKTQGLSGTAAASVKNRADEIFVPDLEFKWPQKGVTDYNPNTKNSFYGKWVPLPKIDGKRQTATAFMEQNPHFFMTKEDFNNTFKEIQIPYKGGTYTINPKMGKDYFKYVHLTGDNKGKLDATKALDFVPAKQKPIKITTPNGIKILQPGTKEYDSIDPSSVISSDQDYINVKSNKPIIPSAFNKGLTIQQVEPTKEKINQTNQVIASTGLEQVKSISSKINKDQTPPTAIPAPWARKWAGGTGESKESVDNKTRDALVSRGWSADYFNSLRSPDFSNLMSDIRLGRAMIFDRPDGQYLHYNGQVIHNPTVKTSNVDTKSTMEYNTSSAQNQVKAAQNLLNQAKIESKTEQLRTGEGFE